MLKGSKQFIHLVTIILSQNITPNQIQFIKISPNLKPPLIIVPKTAINLIFQTVNLTNETNHLIGENYFVVTIKKLNKHFTLRSIKTDRTNKQLQGNIN